MDSKRPILIVGAGLSGLTIARLLSNHDIPVCVFEQSTPDRSQGFGITVRDWAFNPLLEELGSTTSTRDFQLAVATDGSVGGSGWADLTFRNNADGALLFNPDPTKPDHATTLFRANRSSLRNWLADGLDVKFEHKLVDFKGQPGHVKAVFANGAEYEGSMLVAADGVNSAIRGIVLPQVEVCNLPVVLFHGKRYMARPEYDALVKPTLGSSNIAAGVGDGFNTFITVANADAEGVHLDWNYSRARCGETDPLWKPGLAEIIKAPQHLLKEIRSKALVPPFSTLINADDIKKAKVYNWRMRSVYISRADLDQAAQQGVVFVGDSVHAMPIFGGEAGNHAILDGVELFRSIHTNDGVQGENPLVAQQVEAITQCFYDGAVQRGHEAVKRCVQRFSGFHKPIAEWSKVAEMTRRRNATT